MKKLFFLLPFSLSVQIWAQQTIRIAYEFEDIGYKYEMAKKEAGSFVLNYGYFVLEGNDTMSKFYDVEDLRFSNRVQRDSEKVGSIKHMCVSTFYKGTYYTDFVNKFHLSENTFMNKETWIKKDLKDIKWELTRKEKKLLSFDVKLAVFEDETKSIEAWYAPKLPFKIGPLNYHGLPGTILELTIDFKTEKENSFHKVWATDVQLLEKPNFAIPDSQNAISQEKFDLKKDHMHHQMMEMQNQGVEISD